MRHLATALFGIALGACASAPRGPTDAEVRADLDAQVQQVVNAILSGDVSAAVSHFAPDGRMVLNNVAGPDEMLNVDFTGTAQIRSFLEQVGAPPELTMRVTGFTRTGDRAEQTGTWIIAGEQTGTFVLTWGRMDDGMWRITQWRFDGS